MAKRKIIIIDEQKCNGCGNCITGCAEGALQLVNGKAKLVKEQFCDGFGDCIGTCPTGALTIEERDTDEYNEAATRQHVLNTRGEDGVKQFDAAGEKHAGGGCPGSQQRVIAPPPPSGGCPGSRQRTPDPAAPAAQPATAAGDMPQVVQSELKQWPVQLHLVQPGAPFFKDKELVLMSTCGPIACPDVQWRYIRGRSIAVACPKLDRTEGYIEKLAAILSDPSIPRIIVVRMEVPCCGGLTAIVGEAVKLSGRADLVAEEVTVALDGEVTGTRQM